MRYFPSSCAGGTVRQLSPEVGHFAIKNPREANHAGFHQTYCSLLQRRIFRILAVRELVPDIFGVLDVALFIEREFAENGLERVTGAEPFSNFLAVGSA